MNCVTYLFANTEQQDSIPVSPLSPQFSLFSNRPASSVMERFFGSNQLQITTRGHIELSTGWRQTITDNPMLPQHMRQRNRFDLSPQVQLNINARMGDRFHFDMNYNTDATFEFDTSRLRLAYQGDEDNIIQRIEAGNVSMMTQNSLIDGGAALFGIRTDMQFGRLRVNTLLSHQQSERQTITTRGGVQTTPFELSADQFDENRHFFLGYYFRDRFNEAMSRLPYVQSAVSITRVEVWVTNRRSAFDQTRNIVAFADLGEHTIIHNPLWTPQGSVSVSHNHANTLYQQLVTTYQGARNINDVVHILPVGMELGIDFERLENARMLAPTEFTFHSQLGYISLRTPLQSDDLLAVAFEFTYNGQVYQVGEFSSDIGTGNDGGALFLKLLKPVSFAPQSPTWQLMMRNIYSIPGAHSIQREHFHLDITYQSDSIGVFLPILPAGNISDELLLRVMGFDNLNSRNDPFPDGQFDFLDGLTIDAQNGRIIFPVVEPFGSHLRQMIGDDAIADRYVFQQLYDSTLTVARQFPELNRFRISGEFRSAQGAGIHLNAMNVARGSVIVSANGVLLTEGIDYTVDYLSGTVTIINQSILDAGTPISISLENQALFNMQRRTLMGIDLQYTFNRHLSAGTTIMHYRERPLTMRTNFGHETVHNTMWGVNVSYRRESYLITNLLDRLPFVNATVPSLLVANAEFAHLMPGRIRGTGAFSYIDDFEFATSRIDLRQPHAWSLAATPFNNTPTGLFPEAALSNNIEYGKNRALLAWFVIDGMFTRRHSTLTPAHVRDDLDQLSDHRVREIYEREIFPHRQALHGQPTTIPVLNLSFYPQKRGPYNLDVNVDAEGNLLNPEGRWGGMTRRLDIRDFEAANIGYIEFWLMDPFINDLNGTSRGGDLYFNLGEISEDILRDGVRSFESGLPIDYDPSAVQYTVWGRFPVRPFVVPAFDTSLGIDALRRQDVGLSGLSAEEQKLFPTYANFLQELRPRLSAPTIASMYDDPHSPFNSPASDRFRHFRGSEQDLLQLSILERYRFINNPQGNSSSLHGEQSFRTSPDAEGVYFEAMNETEAYYQYKVRLRPENMVVGTNFINDVQETHVRLRNGEESLVRWYQFRIPIRDYQTRVGNIRGFNNIRFMRLFLTGFEEPVFLRFATLDLVRSEWRAYDRDIETGGAVSGTGTISISTVNIEEHSNRTPVNYVLPPGVQREFDFTQPQLRQENEQALSIRIQQLEPNDSRAIFKHTLFDLRRYRRMQMFVHASQLPTDNLLQDDDLSIFMRIGSDFTNNFYEYEIPLRLTPAGWYNTHVLADQETVWRPDNMFDFPLELFTNLKLTRDAQQGINNEVGFRIPFSKPDPQNERNTVTIVGNPSLAEVQVIMVGIRNNSNGVQSGDIWINELRLSDFDERGGWAAQGNVSLALSDIGTITVQGRRETVGFGALSQSLLERRNDNFSFVSFSMNMDLGRFVPEQLQLSAPLFFSFSNQLSTPQYDPFNQDILLAQSMGLLQHRHQRDSLRLLTNSQSINRSLHLSNVRMNIRSRNPMPYDPANFSIGFSRNHHHRFSPEIEYANMTDFRLRVQYSYSPFVQPIVPFRNSENSAFLRSFSIHPLPNLIQLNSNIVRQYNEIQFRDLHGTGVGVLQPQHVHLLTFSQDFFWERDFHLMWNLTRHLRASFRSGTVAEIEEPHLQVNRDINRTDFDIWRDQVWHSIRQLGAPLLFQQTTNITYTLPFAQIPILDWINASVAYNARYRWERGATFTDRKIGNFIHNDMSLMLNMRMNIGALYNRSLFLRERQEQSFWRSVMMVRSININIGHTNRTDIPGFEPSIGNFFGQNSAMNGLVPGLGFAFGFDGGVRFIERARENNKLIINQNNITPALTTETRNLRADATLEPFPGLRINLNALRENSSRTEVQFMFDGMPRMYGGSFAISTWSIGSAFENARASNNYHSAAFERFLDNRVTVAERLRSVYTNTYYPTGGFLIDSPLAGQPFNSLVGDVNHQSADVLIPAFLAAYTGGNPNRIGLSPFPALSALKPNWDVSYNLLTLFPNLRNNFNAITLSHRYISQYRVGAFSSFSTWVPSGDNSGLGFIRDVVSGMPVPSMPYNISTVSLVESFNPLFEVRGEFINNLSASFRMNRTRAVNLNIPSQRIVEMNGNDFVIGVGYRIPNFSRLLGRNSTENANGSTTSDLTTPSFNNDLNLRFDVSNNRTNALIRQIDDGFTFPTGGLRVTTIRFSADYAMNQLMTLRAFFDRMISQPLVAINTHATTNTSAGVSLRIHLR